MMLVNTRTSTSTRERGRERYCTHQQCIAMRFGIRLIFIFARFITWMLPFIIDRRVFSATFPSEVFFSPTPNDASFVRTISFRKSFYEVKTIDDWLNRKKRTAMETKSVILLNWIHLGKLKIWAVLFLFFCWSVQIWAMADFFNWSTHKKIESNK